MTLGESFNALVPLFSFLVRTENNKFQTCLWEILWGSLLQRFLKCSEIGKWEKHIYRLISDTNFAVDYWF